MDQEKSVNFTRLALGTRFKYRSKDQKIFVKLGFNKVAEWDNSQIETAWIGQGIFSASDGNPEDLSVIVVG